MMDGGLTSYWRMFYQDRVDVIMSLAARQMVVK